MVEVVEEEMEEATRGGQYLPPSPTASACCRLVALSSRAYMNAQCTSRPRMASEASVGDSGSTASEARGGGAREPGLQGRFDSTSLCHIASPRTHEQFRGIGYQGVVCARGIVRGAL